MQFTIIFSWIKKTNLTFNEVQNKYIRCKLYSCMAHNVLLFGTNEKIFGTWAHLCGMARLANTDEFKLI